VLRTSLRVAGQPGVKPIGILSTEFVINAETHRGPSMPHSSTNPQEYRQTRTLSIHLWLPEKTTTVARCVLHCKANEPDSREPLPSESRPAYGASAQSAKARLSAKAKNRCHTSSACRPASQAVKWQMRTCDRQPVLGQIAKRSHSPSAGRKSREADGQPQCAQSVKARPSTDCQEPLPSIQCLPTSVATFKRAGAYVR
jgi:hypothetical protein